MEIKDAIIEKFLYNHKLSFSDIWDKSVPSNKFNYHLQKLVSDGLLIRIEEFYMLTDQGKRYVSTLDGSEVVVKPKPLSCVFVVAKDSDGRILFHQRKRQPFLDMYGIPGGKIEYGTLIHEEAAKEFFEETGLTADLELKVVANYLTKNEGSLDVSHHMIGFFYLAKNCKGDLVEENDECRNFYAELSELEEGLVFPDLPVVIPKILTSNSLEFIQLERIVKNGRFTSVSLLG